MSVADVKQEIQNQGRRLTWVAEQLGINHSHLSRQLSGERPITPAQAARMAELLDIDIALFDAPEPAEVV